MFKYVIFLLVFHLGWVALSYAIASLQDDEDDQNFMMNWVYVNGAIFIVWLPLYLKGLQIG